MTIFNINQCDKSGRLLLTVVISIPYDLVSCFDDCLMTILVTFKPLWKKIKKTYKAINPTTTAFLNSWNS